jgi:hypothetical protein
MSIMRRLRSVMVAKPKKLAPLATDTNSTFVYQSGADVQKTWRKYGWIPPTEYRTDYDFGKHKEKCD